MAHLAISSPGPCTHPSASDQLLSHTITSSGYKFLQPPPSLYAASLVLAKRYLDPLAAGVSEAQARRQQNVRKKRKRGEADQHDNRHLLRLTQVNTEGFGVGQIWEQASRILDAGREEVERFLHDLPADGRAQKSLEKANNGTRNESEPVSAVRFDFERPEISTPNLEEVGANDENVHLNGLDATQDTFCQNTTSFDGVEGEVTSDDIAGAGDSENGSDENQASAQRSETFKRDKWGLNDGFFSIDDFNQQSEFLGQQNTRGDSNDSALSGDEDVDWDVDPSSLTLPSESFRNLQSEHGTPFHKESEDSGPNFGNSGLKDRSDSDSASGVSAGTHDDIRDNTNEIMYANFFAPPACKASKRSRALPKTQPSSYSTRARERSAEGDIQHTISSVRRDLFEGDFPSSPDVEKTDPRERHSSHQIRQAALAAEIRRLEAAAVAKRAWTLSGEARATDRPLNALLEEDLEFEHVGKPIPVITNEVSEDIETLIKRRILARDFDEVIRRRPSNIVTGSVQTYKQGGFDLDNNKPQQSLAESYEQDYLRKVDPESYISKQDAGLDRQHQEIETLWADISAKLDTLSSWYYRPKPPSANISVVADVPAISVEDAQPTADAGAAVSRLAPQEFYKAGDAVDKRQEVVTKGGEVVGRAEMSREEKQRRRRREKEKIRKATGGIDGKGKSMEGKRGKERNEVMRHLKRGGVKVVGRNGEVEEVEGTNTAEKQTIKHGGGFKL
ncbi:MAG: hypothetical protein Q9191_006885 [Dirinaria sp. TL-2023a]